MDEKTIEKIVFFQPFLWFLTNGLAAFDINAGYFNLISQIQVTPIDSELAISLTDTWEWNHFKCLSRCVSIEGCWAVLTKGSPSKYEPTLHCYFYTLEHPPSILEKNTSVHHKIALRSWNLDVGIEEKLSETCQVYLLTGEDLVPDENFNCSSYVYQFDGWVYHMAQYSRLNNQALGAGAWCASLEITGPEWLEVFLGRVRLLTGIVTQGRDKDGSLKWVTSYNLTISNSGVEWRYYKENGNVRTFVGNVDQSTPVTNMFSEPVYAAFVRIYPLTWEDWPCIRFDLLGC